MKCNKDGIDIIKRHESLSLVAYYCPAKVLTIGYGHTGPDVKSGMLISENMANKLLEKDLERFEKEVLSLLKVDVSQNQFSALVSFAFNVGSDIDVDDKAEGLGDSTLLKLLNKGMFNAAAEEFPKWNKAKGKVLNGLKIRRNEEKNLFLKISKEDLC
jgi:lysozyme